jgi:ribosomal protein S24E
MEIKVVRESENAFFKRKDLEFEIAHVGAPTPKTDDIKAELASKYGVDKEQIVVDYILTKKGSNGSVAKAKVLKERPVKVEAKPSAPQPAEAPAA